MKVLKFQRKTSLKIPLYEIRVQAGFPSPADDYLSKKLDLNEFLITHPSATFFVEVEGDSMIEAGIFPKDILIVDRSLTPRSGQVVLAVVEGEFTVKRYIKKNGKVVLSPQNPMYPEIEFSENQELIIWGVVTRVLHDPNQL